MKRSQIAELQDAWSYEKINTFWFCLTNTKAYKSHSKYKQRRIVNSSNSDNKSGNGRTVWWCYFCKSVLLKQNNFILVKQFQSLLRIVLQWCLTWRQSNKFDFQVFLWTIARTNSKGKNMKRLWTSVVGCLHSYTIPS